MNVTEILDAMRQRMFTPELTNSLWPPIGRSWRRKMKRTK